MKKQAYLLIHGFAGSPKELQYLYSYLKNKNLDCYTFTLAGHGQGKDKLSQSNSNDWLNSAEKQLEILKKHYKNVALIGFSMGGLISARLASDPIVNKIVLLNTPIFFWNLPVILKDIYKGIINKDKSKIYYYKKSITGTSVKSGIDFLIMLKKSLKCWGNIKKPALILQCENDESVFAKSADYINNKIALTSKMKKYSGGCHQVLSQKKSLRDKICQDIYSFLIY